MHIHYISEQNSILNHFLAQIRDVTIQKDSMRFRKNIERIGEIMAYELSKTLEYKAIDVQTPLGIKHTTTIAEPVVLCSILRAGLALHQGFMNFFDDAENGFVSAYRYHFNHDDSFEIRVEYQSNIYRIFCCFDEGKLVILFNGFQKKTQKTPKSEIELAEKLKKQYFDGKDKK